MTDAKLDRKIDTVVRNGNHTGCGAWCLLDADIVAADFRETNENGYPSFTECDGVSALNLDDLANVQPAQTERRETLLAGAAGALLAGRRIPSFMGLGFWRITRGRPRTLLPEMRESRRRTSGRREDV